MALQDILAAITAEADQQIESARAEHQKTITGMREESERSMSTRKQELAVQKQKKMDQITAKAHAHANAHKRNETLSKKKELLDRLYVGVAKQLGALPEKEVESLLRKCLKCIKSKGEIHPATHHAALLKKICPSEQFRMKDGTKAKGGFLFVSAREEQDFTFEHITEQVLRPKSELETSHLLFA
ncbi:MAG: hypothetical protein QF442_01120 [Candidatus Peribacteraceae bacterium]|jgi:vacuolar-type H+-ATPase subunit E/Vma4|nr:hypothetical protein [Candidatus Peribacteraceae bacterium]